MQSNGCKSMHSQRRGGRAGRTRTTRKSAVSSVRSKLTPCSARQIAGPHNAGGAAFGALREKNSSISGRLALQSLCGAAVLTLPGCAGPDVRQSRRFPSSLYLGRVGDLRADARRGRRARLAHMRRVLCRLRGSQLPYRTVDSLPHPGDRRPDPRRWRMTPERSAYDQYLAEWDKQRERVLYYYRRWRGRGAS